MNRYQGRTSVTFVLSSINRSGGSRVTVEMANRLRERGIEARIAVARSKGGRRAGIRRFIRRKWLRISGADDQHWGKEFSGPLDHFSEINELDFARGEVVVAVGTDAVEVVRSLKGPVQRVRYCHGFALDRPEETDLAWAGQMRTITVSATLIPELEEKSGGKVDAVIPNGLRFDQYYDMSLSRDGVGMVYNTHYNKAPDQSVEALRRIRQEWPNLSLYVFGQPARPHTIPPECYWRYPSVNVARELYNRSKIWVMMSRMEGLPGPVLEAMACGTVVISSDNPGSREIIRDGVNGLLFPVGDVDAMLRQCARVLEDEGERCRLAQGAIERAHQFTWDAAADGMQEFLEGLADC